MKKKNFLMPIDQPDSPGLHCLLDPLKPVIRSFHLGQLGLWNITSRMRSILNSSPSAGLAAMSVASVCLARAFDRQDLLLKALAMIC